MNARQQVVGFGLAMAISGGGGTAEAQRVAADIHIGAGPIVGTVRIGDRRYDRDYGYYGRPRRRAVAEAFPIRIAVERRHGWNPRKHRNARIAVVYFDRHCGQYFDRYRRGLEEVRVLADNERYYWYDDFRVGQDDRYRYDRRGRHDQDRYDRRDDRYQDYGRGRDRDDRRDEDDGEWEHDH